MGEVVWMNKLILFGLLLLCVGFASAYAPRLLITYPVDGMNYTDVSQVKFNLTSPYIIVNCSMNITFQSRVSPVILRNYTVGTSITSGENIIPYNFDHTGTYTVLVECPSIDQYRNNSTIACVLSATSSFGADPATQGHTRYIVDANGNIVGTVYRNQLVTADTYRNTTSTPAFSIVGDVQKFFLRLWLQDQWSKIKNFFGGS